MPKNRMLQMHNILREINKFISFPYRTYAFANITTFVVRVAFSFYFLAWRISYSMLDIVFSIKNRSAAVQKEGF